MQQRNKKIKNVAYVASHVPPFLFILTKTFYETRDLWIKIYYCLIDPKYFKIPFFFFNIDFLFRCFVNLNTGETVLRIKNEKIYEQPNPWTWK